MYIIIFNYGYKDYFIDTDPYGFIQEWSDEESAIEYAENSCDSDDIRDYKIIYVGG